jgi:hypothetical protein
VAGHRPGHGSRGASAVDNARTAAVQIGVVLIALLLALPTRRSLRLNRRRPRVIGARRASGGGLR